VYGLQRLPHTAVVVPGPGDAPTVADANPGILALPTATLRTAAEAEPPTAEAESSAAEVEANIGPPPERLDWRRPVGGAGRRRRPCAGAVRGGQAPVQVKSVRSEKQG